MELDDDTNEALLDNLMASTAQAGKSRGVDPKYLPRFGEFATMMSKGPLMSPPKHLFKKMIQFYLEITLQMTGC